MLLQFTILWHNKRKYSLMTTPVLCDWLYWHDRESLRQKKVAFLILLPHRPDRGWAGGPFHTNHEASIGRSFFGCDNLKEMGFQCRSYLDTGTGYFCCCLLSFYTLKECGQTHEKCLLAVFLRFMRINGTAVHTHNWVFCCISSSRLLGKRLHHGPSKFRLTNYCPHFQLIKVRTH